MDRIVQPELLDQLAADDPRALRSRRDIGLLNVLMGNAAIIARELTHTFSRHLSIRIVEIGAGGGELMLAVARRLRGKWRSVDVTLVDRHDLLVAQAREQFCRLKWQSQSTAMDVLEWLPDGAPDQFEVVIANLFLHQFTSAQLRELLAGASKKARMIIAVEPRRSGPALFFSRCLGLIGCNSVTRHDAPVSVRAGFTGQELSALWPDPVNWELVERPAGLFSHLFVARRRERVDEGLFQPIVSAIFERTAAETSPVVDSSTDAESASRREP